jgi:RNA polymerase sigma-70 factor (ECF subfamily)
VVQTGPARAPPDDPALLTRLKRRDPTAFETLARTEQDRVYELCLRMVGDREEAYDLTQEIFVSVHENLPRFRQDSRVSTWIFRIAKNHCLNRLKYLKRRGRGRQYSFADVSEDALQRAVGEPPRPDAALIAQKERGLLHKALARIDEEQRLLVVLRDVEGLSYEEIVAITDLPEGTVKSRLHRAREKLAALVAEMEP